MTHPYFKIPTPGILGHRGAAGVAPDNTLEAFRRGRDDGADMIECDIHVTRDGVPVLLHDPEVDRTTNGFGAVEQMDFADLQTLDAGYHFICPETRSTSFRDRGVRVPSVREAFESFPHAAFNIEIKASHPDLVGNVLSLIRDFDREERTLLVAGADPIQAQIREGIARDGIRPALGASLGDIVEIVVAAKQAKAHSTDSMAIQVPLDFGTERLVTPALIDHCHMHGVQVHVWTINSPESMRELLDMGVDGIVTDFPGVMAEVIANAP